MRRFPQLYWTDPGLARLLTGRTSLDDGQLFETFVLDELLRWSSWQPDPPQFHFYRTHGRREVDFIMHTAPQVLALEAKASRQSHPSDTRPLRELLETVKVPGLAKDAPRLALVVNRGREVALLAPRVWAIPDWRLFGPAL